MYIWVAAILAAILSSAGAGENSDTLHEDIEVEENSTVTILCPGFVPRQNISESSIKWFKDRTLVAIYQNTTGTPFIGFPKYDGKFYYEATNTSVSDSSLVMNPARQLHEGLYRCEIKADSTIHKASLFLKVTVAARGPVIRGLDAPLVAGSDTILACSREVDSSAEVQVIWQFHDNITSGDIIKRETRYGVIHVTSIVAYNTDDVKTTDDVTCAFIVDNVTHIATHAVKILIGASTSPLVRNGSADSLCWLFGVLWLVFFLLLLFREWQWRRYVKKVQDRTIRDIDIPSGFNLQTVMFPGLRGEKPFYSKSTSVKSNASQKKLLGQKPEDSTVQSDTEDNAPPNGVPKQNGHIKNHDTINENDNNRTTNNHYAVIDLQNSINNDNSTEPKHTNYSEC